MYKYQMWHYVLNSMRRRPSRKPWNMTWSALGHDAYSTKVWVSPPPRECLWVSCESKITVTPPIEGRLQALSVCRSTIELFAVSRKSESLSPEGIKLRSTEQASVAYEVPKHGILFHCAAPRRPRQQTLSVDSSILLQMGMPNPIPGMFIKRTRQIPTWKRICIM